MRAWARPSPDDIKQAHFSTVMHARSLFGLHLLRRLDALPFSSSCAVTSETLMPQDLQHIGRTGNTQVRWNRRSVTLQITRTVPGRRASRHGRIDAGPGLQALQHDSRWSC